jgi:hypothetical protein
VQYTVASGQCNDVHGTLVNAGEKWVVVKEDGGATCWIPAERVISVRTHGDAPQQAITRRAQIIYTPQAQTWTATAPREWPAIRVPREQVFQIPLPPPAAPPQAVAPHSDLTPPAYPPTAPAPPLMPVAPSDRPITTPQAVPPTAPAPSASSYVPAGHGRFAYGVVPPTAYAPPARCAEPQDAACEDIESMTCSNSVGAMAPPHVCSGGPCATCLGPKAVAEQAHEPQQFVISISRYSQDGRCHQQSQLVTTSGRTAWMSVANFDIGVRVDAPIEQGGPVRLAAYQKLADKKPLAVADVRLGDALKLKWNSTQHAKLANAESVEIAVETLRTAPPGVAVYSHPQPSSRAIGYVARAAYPVAPTPRPESCDDAMQVRVYSVAEFVAAPPSGSPVAVVGGVAQHTPNFAPILELVKSQVQPQTWESSGGQAVIHPFPQNYSLVVRQTPQAHQQIAALFEQLRSMKFGDPQRGRISEEIPPAVESEDEE